MIARILRWLFATHEHHWEIVRQGSGAGGSGAWHDCRCKHCGKMRGYWL